MPERLNTKTKRFLVALMAINFNWRDASRCDDTN